MRIWQILAIIALLAAPHAAQAQTYIEIRGGVTWIDDTDAFDPGTLGTTVLNPIAVLDQGWVGALAIGRDPVGPFRYEIEYSHRENDIDLITGNQVNPTPPPARIAFASPVSGKITTDALLIMGYADIQLASAPRLTPYIGAGAGVALFDIEIAGVSDSETMLAIQLSAGFAFEVTPVIDITATASLFFADQDFPLGDDIDQISQTISAGLRFNF